MRNLFCKRKYSMTIDWEQARVRDFVNFFLTAQSIYLHLQQLEYKICLFQSFDVCDHEYVEWFL